MKKVLIRSISGIIYVAIIVGAIFAGLDWFYALCMALTLLGMAEFQQVTGHNFKSSPLSIFLRALDIAAGLLIVSAITDIFLISYVLLFTYFIVRFILTLYDKRPEALRTLGLSFLSVIYIPVPLLLLLYIYNWWNSPTEGWLVLFAFIFIWLNDTGAYCFGSMLGKHRLFERLSPKKSWEGFFGGLLCCMVAAVAFSATTGFPLQIWQWIAIAVITSVFATWGDLFESLIKRAAGVKDSGQLIPGHGGILDRIDSLLFVAPALFLYLFFIF